jgi:CelD/BcsL family acetyltransferase involved in cellulose biosynthesis
MKYTTQTLLDRCAPFRPDRVVDAQQRESQATGLARNPAPVRTVRLQNWADLPGLEVAWTALLACSRNHSVFQTFAWHACWWKAFRDSHELFVILGYAGARLVGIAPMMIARKTGPTGRVRRHVCFIGSLNHASDYCDFIVDPAIPQVLPVLLEEMNAGAEGFDRLDLSHFPSHSPNKAGILEYFQRRHARTTVHPESDAPVRILGDRQSDRKAAGKSSLKRHTRFFEKSGELRFHRCASEHEILGYLDVFFEQHKARRAHAGSPSQFIDPAQQSFYRELVGETFRHGWLRFDVVLFDGAPLAFHFGFEYQRRFIWYKPAFDIRFAARSPGEVLLKFLLDDAIEKGLEEFDFTVGSEPFKYRFSNLTRTNDRIIVFRSAGDYWVQRGIRRGKAVLKNLLGRVTEPGRQAP